MRQALWRVDTLEKVLYLTFDDGPVPGVTDRVLELLGQYNAKATFFCLGKQVHKHPELYAELQAQGHAVGNHTWNHPSGWKTPNTEYFENVARCAELVDSTFFRPPYGRIQRSQLKELSQRYRVVMWDVLSQDYDRKRSPEWCAQAVIRHGRPGSIVVFHDSIKAQQNALGALPQVLEHFTREGYGFRVLPETA